MAGRKKAKWGRGGGGGRKQRVGEREEREGGRHSIPCSCR